ncbi:MAG: undecaprenyldiphospho-muramoylpentapeptide beta-N-acetylglucosaminyltransferase [Gammaproteobacteria bacterium]|nr:undecaprenyldiphospho-muramoylpentapeptide beta-N-acetylglucosaminyltransferase [Gammaproteobacteria bacterium]
MQQQAWKAQRKSGSTKRALIMAGGTGGHVIPGLEIAHGLKEQGYEIIWLGTKGGLEATLVPKNNIAIYYLPVWGVRGKSWLKKLLSPFRILVSVIYSLYILLKFKPGFVLGMGGFASGPGGIAAWLLRVPLVIHEQNAIFGLTNKILSKFSRKVLVSFPDLIKNSQKHLAYTGNPVRTEILSLADPAERWQQHIGSLRVLVLGGSRGALIFNNTVPKAVAQLPVSQRPEIWHQSGQIYYELTVENYVKAGLKAKIEPFIYNMAEAYAWADLVIARAGALTVAELAAAGLPGILIPYPFATDEHQKKNAAYLVNHKAALMINQNDLNHEVLAEVLLDLINARPRLLEMATSARKLSQYDATNNIIKHCEEVSLNATY